MATRGAITLLAAVVCLGVVVFSSNRHPEDVNLEQLADHGAGGEMVSEVGKYADAFSAARNAVISIGGGISSGILSAGSHPQDELVKAPVDKETIVAPVSVSAAHAPTAHGIHKMDSKKTALETVVAPASVSAAQVPTAHGIHKMDAKKAARDIEKFFDAMPTTTTRVELHKAAGAAPKSDAASAKSDSPVAKPAVLPKMNAKKAISDIESYFDAMPTTNVNAFHEPAKRARHFGKTYDADKSRDELDDYFNRLAKGVHPVTYPAKKAVKELTDYYAKLPTSDVSADHDPAAKKPAKRDFKDTQAVKELSDYFDKIPVSKVNAFHERAHGKHTSSLPLYPADQAVKELDSYYSSLPVKDVNAFHLLPSNLAAEERKASSSSSALHPHAHQHHPTPTLKAATLTTKHPASAQAEDNAAEEGHIGSAQAAAAAEEEGVQQVRQGGSSHTHAATAADGGDEAADEEEEGEEQGGGGGGGGAAAAAAAADAGGDDDKLLTWEEVDNRKVYEKGAQKTPAALRPQHFRRVKDDSSFGHTTYQKVGGSDGRASRSLARDEKRMERRMRDKTRNWAALSDEQGSDADAPKLSEMERHEGGYDTQYGMTDRLGSKVIESTPEGDVVTHLVTRKYAKAFPDNNPAAEAVKAASPSQQEQQQQQQQAQAPQSSSAPAIAAAVLPAPIGRPEGVVENRKGQVVEERKGQAAEVHSSSKFRKWEPTPYWKMIGRKGPQSWHAGYKVREVEKHFLQLTPAQQEAALKKLYPYPAEPRLLRQMQRRRQASKRGTGAGKPLPAAAQQPQHDADKHFISGGQGLRARGEELGMQQLAQQGKQQAQELGKVEHTTTGAAAAGGPEHREHKGMAESLGSIIAVGACSVLGIAC